jgi:protein fantom
MIDLLKKRLKDSEGQLKSMQEAVQKSSYHPAGLANQSDLHSKNIKLASLQNRYEELLATMESQKMHYENSKKRLEDINDQLFHEREENNRLKKEIRAMELSVDHIKDVEAKVKELEDEKKNLNMRLKDLCESPFIKQHEERANLQYQIRKQDTDLQKLMLENKSLNELYIKTNSDLERTKKTLDETNNELKQKIEQAAELKATLDIKDKQLGPFKDLDREDDAFLKALGMVKWQGEEPSWYKLDFLERPQKLDIKDPESLLKEIERLRLEKGELAAQLERSQTLLKIQMESEQEESKIYKAQISTLELQLKGAILRSNELSKLVDLKGFGSHEGVEVYEKNGNKYDDRVSVFSDDAASEADTEIGTNYFEIWLGDAELDEVLFLNIFLG